MCQTSFPTGIRRRNVSLFNRWFPSGRPGLRPNVKPSVRVYEFNILYFVNGLRDFNIRTIENYLHVSWEDLVNIVSSLDDLWRKRKVIQVMATDLYLFLNPASR